LRAHGAHRTGPALVGIELDRFAGLEWLDLTCWTGDGVGSHVDLEA
jgi:hypothetical protein